VGRTVATATPLQPVFFYDLSSPACYLAAERIMSALPVVPEWEPVLGSAIGAPGAAIDRESLERDAARQGLLPLRWPEVWPPDARLAALAAAYAKHIGRAVAFSLACFRQVFAGGRDLGEESPVLIAAAACEMHPTAVLRGIQLRSVAAALERANARALAASVSTLPAIRIGAECYQGERALEGAAEALGALA
jgi:2-hydroxychromene-2-carboxylate isomerase